MSRRMNRREFVVTGTAGLAAAAAAPALAAGGSGAAPGTGFGQAPATIASRPAQPVVISSANGNQYKNGGPVTCVEKAFTMMTAGERRARCADRRRQHRRARPRGDSVGYGGLPNADGVVQLDSCCMHGPTKRAGGVAALEGVRTPSLVAKKVMEETDHHLIVGKGAQEFARNMGFKIEDDLNTEQSRKAWLEWKRRDRSAALSRSRSSARRRCAGSSSR